MAKFNFLDKIENIENQEIYQILKKYGKEICDYAKDYFNYIVSYTTEGETNKILTISLYILVPEIKYDYNIISVNMSEIMQHKVKLTFYTLITKNTEILDFDIINGYIDFDRQINELLSRELSNESFKFLVEHVELKRNTFLKTA